MHCLPTIRGEIKKARCSNYENPSDCIFEFIDNAIDVQVKRIRIDIRERTGVSHIHKIIISDDGVDGVQTSKLMDIFSWTFEPKNRRVDSLGEYGAGFKTAAVNLADKLTLITSHDSKCFQVCADWQDMADENRWDPRILPISHDFYFDVHPFKNGSSFILESLRYDIFPSVQKCPIAEFTTQLYNDIAYCYRYILLNKPQLDITIRGIWEDRGEIFERSVRQHPLFHISPSDNITVETEIQILRDSFQFMRVYFRLPSSKKWQYIEFIEKRKNGNSHLRCHDVGVIDPSFVLIDHLQFRSIMYPQDHGFCTSCTIDIIRDGRIVGRDMSLRTPRLDPIQHLVKHELHYHDYILNPFLGVHYNKSTAGRFRDNDLRYTLEHLQFVHEKDIYRLEKRSSEDHPTEQCDKQRPTMESPDDMKTENPMKKRRAFSEQVKISTITAQESRDSVLDIVLRAPIMLLEYDHINGVAAMNTEENCQALSVLTHSVKTRYPKFFTKLEQNTASEKTMYIVDLLNCITRSHYFADAWTNGRIVIHPSSTNGSVSDLLQNGLFSFSPPI